MAYLGTSKIHTMKTFYLLLFTLVTSVSFSQVSGKAYYESKTTVDMNNVGRPDMSEDMKKQIMERMKSFLEKTYMLTFSGNESTYKEEEKLEATEGMRGFGMMMNSFAPGDQYKNLKTGELLEEREFFGKQFLIRDRIPQLNWEVTKESKQIGQYIAIKATAIKQVDPTDFSMMRRRRNREEEQKPADTTKVRDPMDDFEMPKEVIVTAWFTPQIPIQNGPGEFGGLPGLILELNVDRTTVLCSKIIMNSKEPLEIEKPDKGKEVTRDEYNKIVLEKTQEMRENFRDRRPGGNRRFGG